MRRAYYSSSIPSFCSQDLESIIGEMAQRNDFDLNLFQRDAWIEQARVLKRVLAPYQGKIYFEFSIPRMGRRVDAIIIIQSVIFVVEFKVGAKRYESADLDQVMDYALDLHNFHEGSHAATIVPILVATKAPAVEARIPDLHNGKLVSPLCCNSETISKALTKVLGSEELKAVDSKLWEESGYKPTPTIIEATLALYSGHSVTELSRSDATAENISHTSNAIARIVDKSRSESKKSIVIVTGVPGAGKTLVGLNVATKHISADDDLYSVFLSGNGPLVKILQEALARDKVARGKAAGEKVKKGEAKSEVKAFIQNVHHFRDEGLADPSKPPVEHVALFDEAQRAWTMAQTAKFMREKKSRSDFSMSEPEFLISCMDRHKDWATVVCLVGGGQEINTGEAGVAEWFDAVEKSFPHWDVYLSDRLIDSEYGAGEIIERAKKNPKAEFISNLHLQSSLRSFRSENVSLFVKNLLDLEHEAARQNLLSINEKYPIVLTRDLEKAKHWVREQARGTERYGMVVSSNAHRLKPYSIDVRVKTDPVHWFLNGKDDVRSSYYLEDVVTEFDVQGLELDWVCMAWDADFRYREDGWENWSFRGDKWQKINKAERQMYQKNAYRVLLTRARQGMALFVPEGDRADHTRSVEYYESTYRYLKAVGIREI
jgi:DUF2075 family protein